MAHCCKREGSPGWLAWKVTLIAPVVTGGPVAIGLAQPNGVQALVVTPRGLALRVPEDGVSLLSQLLTTAEDNVRSAGKISIRQRSHDPLCRMEAGCRRQGALPRAIAHAPGSSGAAT
jgi:hypothetical protein